MPNILVVDDSPTMRKMVMNALRPLRATFGEAGTGLEAIEQLALRDYDVVMLDLNMPDMHGLEFLQFVRSHQAYRDLPILVLTTRGDEKSYQEALEAGANTYVVKPFSPATLLAAVKELIPNE